MRLRLQTTNVELPHLKAWFSFTEDSQPKSIADLKKSICTTIKSFSNASVTFRDIDLELDGFELLNELSTEGTLRDGDLLAIKRREEVGKKRKADDGDSSFPGKRPRRSKSKLLVSTASSSSSSSSSSSESEIESSASESDSTDSDSDSDSDSSESSALNPNDRRKYSTIPRPPKPLPIKPTAPVQQDHVPPGFGSIKTRKRNIRRRLKKKHEAPKVQGAADTVPSPPKRISIANIAPLGFKSNVSAATVTTAQQSSEAHSINDPLNLTMFSLGNKNKKKGYKYALAPPTTQKKVFTELESYNVSSSSALQGEAEADSDALNSPFPPSTTIFTSAPENPSTTFRTRVIPPSELQSLGKLPKNMFVTSVDVEEDLWRNSLSKKKKKKQRHDQWDENYVGPVSAVPQDGEDKGIDLNYGLNEGEPAVSHSLSGPDANGFDAEDSKSTLIWSVVENDFEAYPQVTLGSLQNGKLVAWKALALNPENYSPEVLLHIATVTAVSAASSGEMPSFSICRLIRPGWEDLDVEDVEGIYGWESVNQMGWKAVNEIKRL
ncbi:hypothetical protein GGU10DRAFT_53942 [Lentinula aff. detonsa]|uniref:Coilin n=1 Tax=Lentinula aff. detonsa TaxID=2804958 RepID=A0AA38TZN3_9AGAR|nr:hypothetical protein GGU10DRAFT_53942 [Lentinula aff. detonsa]